MPMTHKMRSTFVMSASTRAGAAIVGAILSTALISGAPAAAAEAQVRAPSITVEIPPPLIYSPWRKFCGKGDDPGAKEVCFTGKDARTADGKPVVAAALIEPQDEAK